MRHTGTVGGQLGEQGLLQHHVSGKFEVMRGAPVVDLFHEIAGEEFGNQFPIAHTGGLIVSAGDKQFNKVRENGLTVGFFIGGGKDETPGVAITGDLRLIGKETN